MPQTLSYIHTVLPEATWREEVQAHEDRLRPLLDPYLESRSRGEKQPVMDFLFEYYAFRPSHLFRWTPGFGVALEGDPADTFLKHTAFAITSMGVALDPHRFPERRKRGVRWIRDVLEATETRPPFLGCYGMHEWAMVYRTDAVRHNHIPLRMAPDVLNAFVDSRPIVCSHFDAFRFFTPAARPLNHHQPTHDTVLALEQPGCLHANMDLYRWAYKLHPWVPSTLLADTFLLACRIREIDMRASPYDLQNQGYVPIPIETLEGRRVYQEHQQRFMHEAVPLRARLRHVYDDVITWF